MYVWSMNVALPYFQVQKFKVRVMFCCLLIVRVAAKNSQEWFGECSAMMFLGGMFLGVKFGWMRS